MGETSGASELAGKLANFKLTDDGQKILAGTKSRRREDGDESEDGVS